MPRFLAAFCVAALLLFAHNADSMGMGLGRGGRSISKLGAAGNNGPLVLLSNTSIPDTTASGSTVGTLSASNGGTYTYSLVSNPGALFSILGTALKTAASLTAGSYPITVRATGSPAVPDRSFLITVTSTASAAGPMDFSVAGNIAITAALP